LKAPAYDWRCHACNETSPAGTSKCARCGFPAFAPGRKIDAAAREQKARVEPEPLEVRREPHDGLNWVVFLPEGLIAAIVVLAFPFWVLSLLHEASYQAAMALTFFVSSGLGLGWWAWRIENKWLGYAGMVLVLIGAAVAI
jgi:ribosomal protein L37E